MPLRTLLEFLDRENVKYVTVSHSRAYTASEVAAAAHIPGREMVKTVMVKVDGKMAMAVLPSMQKVDLDRLRDVTGAHAVELATEAEFGDLFPGCELGAMPPFGNLWHLDVFVAPSLTQRDRIAFNAGTHTELVQISYAEFERLVAPIVLEFGVR